MAASSQLTPLPSSPRGFREAIPRIGDSSAGARSGLSLRIAGHLGSEGPGANAIDPPSLPGRVVSSDGPSTRSPFPALPSHRARSQSASSVLLPSVSPSLLGDCRNSPNPPHGLWANTPPCREVSEYSHPATSPPGTLPCPRLEWVTMKTRFRRWEAPNSEARRLRQTASYPSRESSPSTLRIAS
jgi:hypothetical protein